MTDLSRLMCELRDAVAWQRTPEELQDNDYLKLIVNGIRTLFIDTGRAAVFKYDMLSVYDFTFDYDFLIDEEKYILLTAQIDFFKKVQSDVNNIVGYTTNALTVTNADKPYAHLQDTIDKLTNERRIVFYKMTRFSMPTT